MCEYAYFIDVGEKKLRKLEIVPLEKAQEKKTLFIHKHNAYNVSRDTCLL